MLNFSIKAFFRDPPGAPPADAIVPIFHGWIRDARIDDDVVIDVADYGHVEHGPGVLLVCHEGHYVIDHRGGRSGLAYHRKRGPEGAGGTASVQVVLGRLLRAAALLHAEPTIAGRVAFDRTTLCVRVLDRLRAPTEDGAWAELTAALTDGLRERFGPLDLEIERDTTDARAPLTAWVRAKPPALLPLP